MIYLHLRSQQPLCLAAQQTQGNIRRSLDYIPGSALRGALAARLRAAEPAIDQARFDRLILGDQARFLDLHPLPLHRKLIWPRSLPQTARTCKHYEGFLAPPEPRKKPSHGVRDLLFPWLRYRLGADLPEQGCGHQGCPLPLEPFSGSYTGFSADDYKTPTPKRRQVTQTAIDPHRETASPSNLFTVEALEEGTDFAGFFALGDPAAEADFCDTVCSPEQTLRLGYGRTRGLGQVEIVTCKVATPYLWQDELTTRLTAFNDKARTMQCNTPPDHTLFALTLLSDTILLDPFFRHQTGLDGATLAREIHPDLGDCEPVAAFAGSRQVFGWSSPQCLPLPTDLALTVGSVFVFQSSLTLAQLTAIFTTTAVEQTGIGERRTEGFGQVVVCHPFHQEVSPV